MLRNLLTICAFALVLSPVVTTRATTIYVKADSTGDVATLHDAMAIASPDDTVLVAPGTYEVQTVDLAPGVHVISEVLHGARIMPYRPTYEFLGFYCAGPSGDAEISGFWFDAYTRASMGIGAGVAIHEQAVATITNCLFTRNRQGVTVSNGAWAVIRNNIFKGNDAAVQIWEGVVDLYNNTTLGNGLGLDMRDSWYTEIHCSGNIFWDPIETQGVPILCNDLLNIDDAHPFQEVNFSADPLFCGSDGLRIPPESPCAPGNIPVPFDCGLYGATYIGAYPPGCNSTPIKTMTWGQLKALMEGRGD